MQLARKCTPDRLALAVVDLKALDFVALAGLSHLVKPVATEEADAQALVSWCVGEMERRQAVMSAAQVTRWDRLPEEERFPLLLVVVDECADFGNSLVMGDLVKLARKSRASGIALIMATQRPDKDVLSRQVKACLTTRLAFRVTDSTESRIILDRIGAEQIKRVGLALCNVGGEWRKVQTAFVPDESVGEWVDIAPVCSILSKVEQALVAYAVRELNGCFIIGKLYDAVGGISKYALTKLAQEWERRGWLTETTRTAEGHKRGRTVTPELASLALGTPERDIVTSVTSHDMGQESVMRPTAGRDVQHPPFLAARREAT